MKKLLIGTTALVAGGLIAGSALAAEKIVTAAPEVIDDGFTVTWNGYIRAGIYAGDNDCTDAAGLACVGPANNPPNLPVDANGTTVPLNAELQLFAEQTLANGLRVGGEIDFDIDNGDNQEVRIDEIWLFIDGNFGQIRVGRKEGALASLGGGALPGWGAFNGGTDGPDMAPLGGELGAAVAAIAIGSRGSIEDISGDAAKVTYLSPTFAGINFAASFSPDPQNQVANGSGLALNGNADEGWLNEWSVAANYTVSFGDHTLLIAGGFTAADAEKNNVQRGDVTIWKIAGSLKNSIGGVGGWYSVRDFDTFQGAFETPNGTVVGTTTWGVTANIVSGDYTVGGGYTRAEDDVYSRAGFNNTDNELDLWGIGISKSLGTGVEMGVNATFEDYTGTYDANAATRGTNADGWLAGWYTAIAF